MAQGRLSHRRGFTVIEVLTVLFFLSLLAAGTVPLYRTFIIKYQLVANAEELQQLVRTAQNLSMANRADSQYGVHLVSGAGGQFVLFKGASYATRDTTYDEISYDLPSSLSLSETVSGEDIVFTKFQGGTSNTGTVTLTSTELDTRTVTVNAAGMVELD
jgi:type II secretory pathway pseudopilin PulG